MPKFRTPLHVVFYREDGDWIAHCLQFDLCGNGETKPEAFKCLVEAIKVQIEEFVIHRNTRSLFCPADSKYLEMFSAGKDVAVGTLELSIDESIELSDVQTREYHDDSPACGDADLVLA